MSLMQEFLDQDADYYYFRPEIKDVSDLKCRVENNIGVRIRYLEVLRLFNIWRGEQELILASLLGTKNLGEFRGKMTASFTHRMTVESQTPFDRFQAMGAVANWYDGFRDDIRRVASEGFRQAASCWFVDVLEIQQLTKRIPIEHVLIAEIAPYEMENLTLAEASLADVRSEREALLQLLAEAEELPEGADLDQIEQELPTAKRMVKAAEKELMQRVEAVYLSLSDESAQAIVLAVFKNQMLSLVEQQLKSDLAQVVRVFENWWQKYHKSLAEMESERAATSKSLNAMLTDLGYLK